jgi:hypothetical protein
VNAVPMRPLAEQVPPSDVLRVEVEQAEAELKILRQALTAWRSGSPARQAPWAWGALPMPQHSPKPCAPPPLALALDPAGLRPFIAAVVREVLSAIEADRATVPERLAFGEPEAARLLSLEPHQLRDERLRGRISASHVVGRRIRYLRQDLLDYMAARRIEASAA